MYPTPTVEQLADFSGQPASSYEQPRVNSALAQAALLFGILTGLSSPPEDETEAALALNAILEMARDIYLKQPYQEIQAKPFQSETIMSYSYSKGSTVAKAADGGKTGLFWWDTALSRLSTNPATSLVSFGSIAVFERGHNPVTGAGLYRDDSGNIVLLGPADLIPLTYPLDYSADFSSGVVVQQDP